VSRADDCEEANARLAFARHYPLLSARQRALLSARDDFERRIARIAEHT
jgi:hypothetical protein